MKRIDADGHVANKFSDGVPGVSDATTVDASFLNATQEEICGVIEGAGLTVDQEGDDLAGPLPDNGQLLKAIKALIGVGGSPLAPDILNNQAVAQDLTGLVWDKTVVLSVFLDFDLRRKSATQHVKQQGRMHIFYDEVDDAWDFEIVSYSWDDAETVGVTFSIAVDGNNAQLQYVSTDLAGGTYVGKFRVTNITTIKV